jgi:hypothetical protein
MPDQGEAMNGNLVIPRWGLWMMFIASTLGSFLLFQQLRRS